MLSKHIRNLEPNCQNSFSSSEIVAKSLPLPHNLCMPLKTFACVSLRYRNIVGGGWVAIVVVVCGKICGKMCGKKGKKPKRQKGKKTKRQQGKMAKRQKGKKAKRQKDKKTKRQKDKKKKKKKGQKNRGPKGPPCPLQEL